MTSEWPSWFSWNSWRHLCVVIGHELNFKFSLAAHREDDAKPRLAAQHAFVGLGYALQGKNLIHRTYASKHAESKRVLRIYGSTGIPALHRQASADEMNGRNREERR